MSVRNWRVNIIWEVKVPRIHRIPGTRRHPRVKLVQSDFHKIVIFFFFLKKKGKNCFYHFNLISRLKRPLLRNDNLLFKIRVKFYRGGRGGRIFPSGLTIRKNLKPHCRHVMEQRRRRLRFTEFVGFFMKSRQYLRRRYYFY